MDGPTIFFGTQFAGHVYLEIFAGLEPRLMQIELAGGLPMHDAT